MSKDTRNLLIFFGLTFIWTWAFYAPLVITGNSPYQMPWMILLILGGAGPSIIGLALVFLTYDREKRRDYWRRCFSRISLFWWLVILFIFPLIFALSILVDRALGGSNPGMTQLQDLIANPIMLPMVILMGFLSGPLSEELGWRGYALDPLLKRFGTLGGSVILGIIWGVWHLPLFFMPATWHGQMGFQLAGFWTFLVMSIGLTLIMTWVYRSTNRSILSAVCLHFASNFTANLLLPVSNNVEFLRAALMLGIGMIACVLLENRTRQPGNRPIEHRQPT